GISGSISSLIWSHQNGLGLILFIQQIKVCQDGLYMSVGIKDNIGLFLIRILISSTRDRGI
ncbi:hypothetical protein ACWDGP_000854, partial [Cronobacter sakazakii]